MSPTASDSAESRTESADRYFYEPEIETASRGEISDWQERRVLELIPYLWERSGFYRDLWSAAGVTPDDITSLDDFYAKIPMFRKADLKAYRERTGDPFADVLCVDPTELTSIGSTSGTTSLPEFSSRNLGCDLAHAHLLGEGAVGDGIATRRPRIGCRWVLPRVLGPVLPLAGNHAGLYRRLDRRGRAHSQRHQAPPSPLLPDDHVHVDGVRGARGQVRHTRHARR